ncbi:thiol reductant ABC exporter subunit CydC [Corynebacterium xerosis]|uniref:thiol reductant ABC exporter subunit CydC n=1 Tax=Corynebacterium xerosis TaxID=1725 RepID=UPI00366B6712
MSLSADLRALRSARPVTGLRWRELVAPVVAGSVTLISALALTIVSAWLITKAWQQPSVMDLTVAVTAVRALGISRAVFRYVDRVVSHDLALRCAARTRVSAYRVLADDPSSRVLRLGRGALLTRLGDDVDLVSDVVVRALVPAGVAVTTSAAAIGFTALLSPAAAAVLAIGLIIAGTCAPWAAARAARIAAAERAAAMEDHVSAVDRVLVDSPALRVRGEIDGALADADRAARRLAHAEESAAPADAAGNAISVLSSALTVIAVLVVAGMASPDHSPQWMGVLALLPLAAFESVAALPGAAVAVTGAAGAARRLAELSDSTGSTDSGDSGEPAATEVSSRETSPNPAPEAPRVHARNLVYGHDRDVGKRDLDLPFGARGTIVEPSGSGKTTLLMTLAGLLPARGGEWSADGALFVAEDGHVFATTVRDNLAVGAPHANDDLMNATLRAVGLGDWVAGLPDGLGTLLAAGADDMSGGQRRRLLLARALLTGAPILLLDEPFEHLDVAGAAELRAILDSPVLPGARPERTIIVVEHPRTDGRG